MSKLIKLIKDNETCYFTTDKITAMFEPDKLVPLKNSHHVIMIVGCPPQQLSEEAYNTILGAWKGNRNELELVEVNNKTSPIHRPVGKVF